MIKLSHCKINLGLNIIAKREDGFHNLETVMYPVTALSDVVELQPAPTFSFSSSGLRVDCPEQKNLCVRAFRLMQQRFDLPEARLHLHKNIAMGAGLGGGSANATAVIELCNLTWQLGLDTKQLETLAAEIGSDTAFFIRNCAALATGRGEILEPIAVDLSGYYLVMIKPAESVSTAKAYAGVTPRRAEHSVRDTVHRPITEWRWNLENDFEASIFSQIPLLRHLKEQMYARGAIYASMSGSGSTIFGIFSEQPLFDPSQGYIICRL